MIKINLAPNVIALLFSIVAWVVPNLDLSLKAIIFLSIIIVSLGYNLTDLYIQFSKFKKQQKLAEVEFKKKLEESETNREALAKSFDKHTQRIDELKYCLDTTERLLIASIMHPTKEEQVALIKIYDLFLKNKNNMKG
ncbi:hypothetical protein M5W68_20525 [Paenibacillus larvae]|uniref:hypothetical protein n=1 Tax=Paenibacillus larvae TaxID=1464 RepID=UPI00227EFD36|nr:hypothetical protein [Paenibacillus larvae]MCY9512487.1 hypothetical protein [Paenibacillus larvae]MCY9527415.1 hypothetical protein [Paenibacillus larvae]